VRRLGHTRRLDCSTRHKGVRRGERERREGGTEETWLCASLLLCVYVCEKMRQGARGLHRTLLWHVCMEVGECMRGTYWGRVACVGTAC
jgi:hypothetical protein